MKKEDNWRKPEIKELAGLLWQIDIWECSTSSEMYPQVTPKVGELHRLFAQIDILQKSLSKGDPETFRCVKEF